MAQDLLVAVARLEDIRNHTEQDETLHEVTPQPDPHLVLTQSPVTNRLPAVTSSDSQGHQVPAPPLA